MSRKYMFFDSITSSHRDDSWGEYLILEEDGSFVQSIFFDHVNEEASMYPSYLNN